MTRKIAGIITLLTLLASGCSSHDEPPSGDAPIPPQFTFIFTTRGGVTFQQVTNKLGKPARIRGKRTRYYEYDLTGGGAVLIGLEPPSAATSMVRSIESYSSTNLLKSFP